MGNAPRPQGGDIIIDPSHGRNRVLDVRHSSSSGKPTKLLLEDETGVRFVIGGQRLEKNWRHVATQRAPKPARSRPQRLGRLPYIPRERAHGRAA